MFTGLVNIRSPPGRGPAGTGIIISRAGLAVIFRIVRIFRQKAPRTQSLGRDRAAPPTRGRGREQVYHTNNERASSFASWY